MSKTIRAASKMPNKPQENSEPEFVLERSFPDTSTLLQPYGTVTVSDESVLVAFDTNVLLLPYKLGQKNLKELREAYDSLAKSGRLFIPARVLREFVRQRDQHLAELVKTLNDRASKPNPFTNDIPHLLEQNPAYANIKTAADKIREATEDYNRACRDISNIVKSWRGNDPVTELYRQIFTDKVIVDHAVSSSQLLQEWEVRRRDKIPPGYKDAAKDDTGIGDYLIWKILLKLGETHKKNLIFVSGEQKSDWFVRAGSQPIYTRPEIINEYKRASCGKNIRISSLQEVL